MHPEITRRLAADRRHELARDAAAARAASRANEVAPPPAARTWRRPSWLRVPRLRTVGAAAPGPRRVTPAI